MVYRPRIPGESESGMRCSRLNTAVPPATRGSNSLLDSLEISLDDGDAKEPRVIKSAPPFVISTLFRSDVYQFNKQVVGLTRPRLEPTTYTDREAGSSTTRLSRR